jgi:predicted adenylyl cyclase CyaB
LRIRIISDKNKIEITKKEGNYDSLTRKETNKYIDIKNINQYLETIKSKGFKKYICVKTKSYVYQANNLTIALNTISDLGMIVEVEATTNNKLNILRLGKKISSIMNILKLKELNSIIYQKMIDKLYLKKKNISKQNFKI